MRKKMGLQTRGVPKMMTRENVQKFTPVKKNEKKKKGSCRVKTGGVKEFVRCLARGGKRDQRN